jgi:hypothetical protein
VTGSSRVSPIAFIVFIFSTSYSNDLLPFFYFLSLPLSIACAFLTASFTSFLFRLLFNFFLILLFV